MEFFKIIYLNRANSILSIEDVTKGTVDQASIYPREVIKRALDISASGIIFVHHHPSGNMEHSKLDIILQKGSFQHVVPLISHL